MAIWIKSGSINLILCNIFTRYIWQDEKVWGSKENQDQASSEFRREKYDRRLVRQVFKGSFHSVMTAVGFPSVLTYILRSLSKDGEESLLSALSSVHLETALLKRTSSNCPIKSKSSHIISILLSTRCDRSAVWVVFLPPFANLQFLFLKLLLVHTCWIVETGLISVYFSGNFGKICFTVMEARLQPTSLLLHLKYYSSWYVFMFQNLQDLVSSFCRWEIWFSRLEKSCPF